MWLEIFDPTWWRWLGALGAIGLAIKLTDDFLDIQEDRVLGKVNMASRLGPSVLPYSLVAALLSASLAPKLAFAYYIAAYGIGMVKDPQQVFLSKLQGWQEICLTLVISLIAVGWVQTLVAWAMMLVVQLVDDLLDFQKEPTARNLAIRYGRAQVTLVMVLLVLVSCRLASSQVLALFGAWLGLSWFCRVVGGRNI